MAERVEIFDVSCVANTAKSAATTTPLSFTDGIVVEIEIVIPDGHLGLTGIAILYGGVQVIPQKEGQFISGNNEPIRWPVARFPTGSRWQAKTFNLDDTYDHGWSLRFLLDEIGVPATPAILPIVITSATVDVPATEPVDDTPPDPETLAAVDEAALS